MNDPSIPQKKTIRAAKHGCTEEKSLLLLVPQTVANQMTSWAGVFLLARHQRSFFGHETWKIQPGSDRNSRPVFFPLLSRRQRPLMVVVAIKEKSRIVPSFVIDRAMRLGATFFFSSIFLLLLNPLLNWFRSSLFLLFIFVSTPPPPHSTPRPQTVVISTNQWAIR